MCKKIESFWRLLSINPHATPLHVCATHIRRKHVSVCIQNKFRKFWGWTPNSHCNTPGTVKLSQCYTLSDSHNVALKCHKVVKILHSLAKNTVGILDRRSLRRKCRGKRQKMYFGRVKTYKSNDINFIQNGLLVRQYTFLNNPVIALSPYGSSPMEFSQLLARYFPWGIPNWGGI